LNARDASKALSISEPTLRGLRDLPRVRLGSRTLYRTATLDAWLAQREQSPADEQADATEQPTPDVAG
jgi:hypothetical protein